MAGAREGAPPGQTSAGDWDIFALKLSPAGVELWTYQSGSSGSDGALAMAVDGSGNIILVAIQMAPCPARPMLATTLPGCGSSAQRA